MIWVLLALGMLLGSLAAVWLARRARDVSLFDGATVADQTDPYNAGAEIGWQSRRSEP